MDNVLHRFPDLEGEPPFDRIRPEHAEPAIDRVLAENRARIRALLDGPAPSRWDDLVEPLEDCEQRLTRIWSAISHLWAVHNTKAWREAHDACQPKVTAYYVEWSQSDMLHAAYRALSGSPEFARESPARRKAVSDALRNFRLSGVALPVDQKRRFREHTLRLSDLQSKFEERIVDATQAWSRHVADAAHLDGMTDRGLAQAAAKAQDRGLDGHLLTLDYPSYEAVITYAEDRALREEIYRAWGTRASDQGPQAGEFDNSAALEEILSLQFAQARLLDFPNPAACSLETKMAESVESVRAFLRDLAQRARPHAKRELDTLRGHAAAHGHQGALEPWDLPLWAERYKQAILGFSEDELRPWFPAAQVLQGLFELTHRLYGVRFERARGAPAWHPDVTVWSVIEDDQPIGRFYIDAYARDEKRGGAWMGEWQSRRRGLDGRLHPPVAFLTCNFAPPLDGQPALLTHDEVVTLFHEFGHGLHQLLTRVEEASVSGINGVEWDAVELPSQFMENWCFSPAGLAIIARHHETGAPLPADRIAQLQASRRFLAGLDTLRQVEFALFDLELHSRPAPPDAAGVQAILDAVRDDVAVLRPPAWHRFQHTFSHIFAGGYAAGYYSYKWAEVLSADAFAAFDAEDPLAGDTGRRFRDAVLANGGSRPAMELFRAFRGREPRVDALLAQDGLLERSA